MSRTPELSDPRTYVSNQGIVELHYGVENSTVEWQQDLYDYVRESLAEGETIDPELCLKDKETGKRYWFACIVCPCNLYKDENLVSHVKGQKHQKRAIEKLSSQSNLSRNAKRKRGSDYQESTELGSGFSRPSNSRSSRSELQDRIMSGAEYPFLGLEYITEYLNPGNPNKDPMYTCSLEGCKSAWGSASEMYNHLTSSKNKHNRSYLTKYYEIPNLTVDQIFNKSLKVFEDKKTENNNRVDVNIKQVSNSKQYKELKNRDLNWSEKTARREKEKPQSDLTHYKIPSKEEKARSTFEAFDTLQTQMQLVLEQLQNPSTSEETAGRLKIQMDRCVYQCDTMFAIFKRNSSLMSETRLEQTAERHSDLKTQYENLEHQLAMNRQSNNIAFAHQFTHDISFEERNNHSGENKEKKSKLDVKNNSKLDIKKMDIKKMDIKMVTPVALGDNSAYCDEIGRALDTAGSKISNQDMKDLFKDKVCQSIKELVVARGYKPTSDQIERITEKISSAEINRWGKNQSENPEEYSWSHFLFSAKHEKNVKDYVDLKFGRS